MPGRAVGSGDGEGVPGQVRREGEREEAVDAGRPAAAAGWGGRGGHKQARQSSARVGVGELQRRDVPATRRVGRSADDEGRRGEEGRAVRGEWWAEGREEAVSREGAVCCWLQVALLPRAWPAPAQVALPRPACLDQRRVCFPLAPNTPSRPASVAQAGRRARARARRGRWKAIQYGQGARGLWVGERRAAGRGGAGEGRQGDA